MCYGVRIIHPPKRNSRKPWPKRLRRWVAGIRQIVESVYDKLFNAFSDSGGSAPMSWKVCEPAWRRSLSVAQLLHLAQRSPRPPTPGLCRLVGLVISKLTPEFENPNSNTTCVQRA
jgi:hypothetical protein